MRNTLIALTAATALVAGTATLPSEAEAYPAWVIPAIIGAAVGGVVVGGGIASSRRAYAYPNNPPLAYSEPVAQCRVARVQTPSGAWRRVKVCDPY